VWYSPKYNVDTKSFGLSCKDGQDKYENQEVNWLTQVDLENDC